MTNILVERLSTISCSQMRKCTKILQFRLLTSRMGKESFPRGNKVHD